MIAGRDRLSDSGQFGEKWVSVAGGGSAAFRLQELRIQDGAGTWRDPCLDLALLQPEGRAPMPPWYSQDVSIVASSQRSASQIRLARSRYADILGLHRIV